MGIKSFFSTFTIVGDVKKLFTKEKITALFAFIQAQIELYVSKNDLLGAEKKAQVDAAVVAYIKEHFKSNNTYVNLVVGLVIQYEPQITQAIYTWLKAFVPGLTETTTV